LIKANGKVESVTNFPDLNFGKSAVRIFRCKGPATKRIIFEPEDAGNFPNSVHYFDHCLVFTQS